MATNTKTLGGKEYFTNGNRIKKMSDIPIDIPHIMVSKYPNPTKYGSFVVELQNEDTNENFKCYMPAYIAKEYQAGKVFIYNGLQAKNDGSGHTYHRVMWRKK